MAFSLVPLMQVVEKTAFEDEAERKREFAAQRRETEAEKVRDAYNQLKFTAVRPITYAA
jgi:hypothetical protein